MFSSIFLCFPLFSFSFSIFFFSQKRSRGAPGQRMCPARESPAPAVSGRKNGKRNTQTKKTENEEKRTHMQKTAGPLLAGAAVSSGWYQKWVRKHPSVLERSFDAKKKTQTSDSVSCHGVTYQTPSRCDIACSVRQIPCNRVNLINVSYILCFYGDVSQAIYLTLSWSLLRSRALRVLAAYITEIKRMSVVKSPTNYSVSFSLGICIPNDYSNICHHRSPEIKPTEEKKHVACMVLNLSGGDGGKKTDQEHLDLISSRTKLAKLAVR